jgi:CHAD domain-containing protein
LLQLAALLARATRAQLPGYDFLLGLAQARRADAQVQLQDVVGCKPHDWPAFIKEILESVSEPQALGPGATLGAMARPHLLELLRALEEAARRDLGPRENLHQVRILGKRLRYAMEIFAGCFGPAFKKVHYPAVEDMQDILGSANDSLVAIQRLEEIRTRLRTLALAERKRLRPGIDSLVRFHRRRLPQLRRQFQRWRQSWERSGAEAAFAQILE